MIRKSCGRGAGLLNSQDRREKYQRGLDACCMTLARASSSVALASLLSKAVHFPAIARLLRARR